MTEQVFEKAKELNEGIRRLRRGREELEEAYELLSDEVEHDWEIETRRNDCSIFILHISPDSAELALIAEMEKADKELKYLENEFENCIKRYGNLESEG